MRLVIDAVGTKMGGGAFVLQDVIAAALRHPAVTDVVAFTSPLARRSFALAVQPRLMEQEQPLAEVSDLARLWWARAGMARAARRARADAVLCLTGIAAPPPGIRSANFIQQSLPFAPELPQPRRTRARLFLQRRLMRDASRHASLTFVQTETMKRVVSRAFRLSPDSLDVFLPTARSIGEASRARTLLAALRKTPVGNRILWVGYDGLHKNLPVLEEAARLLSLQLPGARLFVSTREGIVSPASNIVQLGELEGAALATAYSLADVLVMPSLVETVGLSMVEALSFGVPVVAADRGFAHDVCEDAAIFFDPTLPRACAQALERILRDSELRTTLSGRARGLHARRAQERPYDRMISSLLGLPLPSAAGRSASDAVR